MKVAIFCPYNLDKPGGVQEHVKAQANELRSRGHSVWILTPRPRQSSLTAPEGIIYTGVSARIRAQSSTVDISSLMDPSEISELYRKHRFDVVHFHEPVVPFVGRQLIMACPFPVVATLHAALPDRGLGKTLGSIKPYFRSVLQNVDLLTRVSAAAGEYLDDELDGYDVVEVPNGLIVDNFIAKGKRSPATVLFIGRLEKRKGPKQLIKAFELLKERIPQAKLIIAGDGPERESLEKYVFDQAINGVEFLGYITEQQKASLLSTATVACYPALYGESFGIVLLEAMAMGAPIVAGNNSGYSSVLRGKGLLSLVNPKDSLELAVRLQLFIEDEDVRQMMRQWGLAYVRQFDYSQIVSQYEKVYKQAVRSQR